MRAAISFIKSHFSELLPLNGVEIGVSKGDHAEEILAELYIGHLRLIDPYLPYVQEGCKMFNLETTTRLYHEALSRFSGCPFVEIWREDSKTAAEYIEDSSLHFVYIDACHSYEAVKEDIALWMPKVVQGGIVSGHDYDDAWPGVKKAVDELREKYNVTVKRMPQHKQADWWFLKI